MQQELIEMLDKMVKYFDEISSDSYLYRETAAILNEAEKLVEKAKNGAKEPAVPDVMSILRAIHRRPSDAGIWLDDITRILRDAPAPAVPQGEPVLVQHRKPIVGKDGETIGYTNWIDGNGLDWWPHRSLYAAPSQPVTLTDGLIEKGAMTGMVDAQIDDIIAALREKQGGV